MKKGMKMKRDSRVWLWSALAFMALSSGCASVGGDPRDPAEPMNRAVFSFNKKLDRAVVKPVAEGYKKVVPSIARRGVGNVFGNLGDVGNFANALLQAKGEESARSFMRFAINTVFGIGGLFDVASEAGLAKAEEDFGLTLGTWGVGSGPYLVLPILGPSTVRDAAGLPVDCALDLSCAGLSGGEAAGVFALKVEHERSNLLGADDAAAASLDEYAMIRDFYLGKRDAKLGKEDDPLLELDEEDHGKGAAPSEGKRPETGEDGKAPEKAAAEKGVSNMSWAALQPGPHEWENPCKKDWDC